MKTKQSKTKSRTKVGRTASLRCDALVGRLVRSVGKGPVASILAEFEGQIEGYTSRKSRLLQCKTLCVMHTYEIDGG